MTSRWKTNSLVHTLAILALILASPAVADDGGAATIEELIEQCKGKTSLAELLPMVHPDDQPLMGFVVVMMGSFAPMMAMPNEISGDNEDEANALAEKLTAEYEALEKKHGLQEPPEDAPSGETPEGMAMRARYTFDGVDIAAFITDVEEWLMSSIGEEVLGGGLTPDFALVEELQVEGDSATARVDGKPIEFIRYDDRWYLRISM